jgi:hypothetical protein
MGTTMKNLMMILPLCMLLNSPSSIAAKHRFDGNELIGRCTDKYDSFNSGYCRGLVIGIEYTAGSDTVCTPYGVTNGQLIRIVLKYLKDHPELLHRDDTSLIHEALQKAFPC